MTTVAISSASTPTVARYGVAVASRRRVAPHLGHTDAAATGATGTVIAWPHPGQVARSASAASAKLAITSSWQDSHSTRIAEALRDPDTARSGTAPASRSE